ncbi:hypothetical protein N1031_07090 [Herbiconiux moechotypicola]|uniref:Uncharacterized protein n=1 Tax=Herbiconiux moechotypicola TaxID=637393 RepID=A0ABP5QDS0_9MICO|nr:hypothetical protein [Herbiconiux moechotypicola]MCS5729522.1 hypothetical protein [Herbiconiux moechotypicola]
MSIQIATAIFPTDFAVEGYDPSAARWTAGKVRHIVRAMSGAPCIITTDARTGFTLIGARLLEVRDAPGGVEILTSDGTAPYWSSLDTVGPTIIPLTGDGEKWRSIDSYRAEQDLALARAHRDADPHAPGRWIATPGLDYVDVTFTPDKSDPRYAEPGDYFFRRYALHELG